LGGGTRRKLRGKRFFLFLEKDHQSLGASNGKDQKKTADYSGKEKTVVEDSEKGSHSALKVKEARHGEEKDSEILGERL